ncbi:MULTISPECIES: 1,4-alpha-glucan branching protein GlgB [Micromonospora]|uniref:1,4-alpha-glucan branching enzyme GlgB n=1 Tax=Micromonospora solifontis TaxID=2487138 RepID=A0ABX9WBU5_9ACTN|nr:MULTISPECIES: 1,4-alpha-glucan branching protein GlgB [Micromonospora]NES15492.1 1,4-alpha-glucan branching protein GlgB [Micromonospora sp. PPF5-17B]NES39300.1 1,4-alpha-glucan branching protein GlgB [Micromonospora solifontis]NES55281.1 1,4-alpha-glucan branching protein GlgB [Micromonospora sp. PPF5-6]RNL89595.1 1,4-alpha-glucan branching protein GlgB [Micromonospora solifontis]
MEQLITGEAHDPHAVLGAHPGDGRTTIRTMRRGAGDVAVLVGDERHPMKRVHDAGVFEAVLPGEVLDYRVEVDGAVHDDPYRYPPTLGELDLHLIAEGRHERLWEALGARVFDEGVAFTVWAPNARGVRVVGDFTGWGPDDGWPMRSLGSSGVWEVFVPGVPGGARYKYRILGADGHWRDKADPLAARTEVPPATASVVHTSAYEWGDADWLARRAGRRPHQEPMSVYEVHLGSWRPGLGYRELAEQLTGYVTELGFTHVEFLPVMEHPFGGSWGYQVTGYYAPTARFGDPDDFRYLVDRLHQAGIGVILDWVPAHFPKDEWALARFDGTPLYEHPDPRRGEHPDWGTYVFDFGRREVRNFLVANALYWLAEFHVDGLRVDAVASMLYLDYSRQEGQWVPNVHGGRENLEAIAFLQEVNATVYKHHAGTVMVAEESTAWPGVTRPTSEGGLGFGFKWNMGWMHDTLLYTSKDPIYRQHHHHQLTFSLAYAWSENYVLPISHDEVVHGKGSLVGKMPGDTWQRLANVRALLAYMWAHPGKQLLFMGCELADDREWSEERGLDWYLTHDPARAGVQRLVGDLNRVYRATPALWAQDTEPAGFRWIAGDDVANNTVSFVRIAPDGGTLVCVANFSARPLEGYRIGLPAAGTWTEVLNTDAHHYGGSGVGNLGAVQAENVPWHGMVASAELRVPPLGVLWLRRD